MFKTDLNQRERTRYASMLRDLAKAAIETATELETEPFDDTKFVIAFIMFSLMTGGLNELQKIIKEASTKEQARESEFPSIIGG